MLAVLVITAIAVLMTVKSVRVSYLALLRTLFILLELYIYRRAFLFERWLFYTIASFFSVGTSLSYSFIRMLHVVLVEC